MHYTYKMSGVCSSKVDFDIIEGRIHNVVFTGGCSGNLKAISKLVENMPVAQVAETLQGNTCGGKSTSCADQFSRALMQAIAKEEK